MYLIYILTLHLKFLVRTRYGVTLYGFSFSFEEWDEVVRKYSKLFLV